jgi:carboxyl-terminal processing protease
MKGSAMGLFRGANFLKIFGSIVLIVRLLSSSSALGEPAQVDPKKGKDQQSPAESQVKPGDEEVESAKDSEQDLAVRYESLEAFARGLFFLETLYVDTEKVTSEIMVQSALKGIVDQLDPHTAIMPPKAFEKLTSDTQGRFGGVGIIVATDQDRVVVISAMEGSPAARAGIVAGDEIVAIDSKPVSAMPVGDAVDSMRGEPGSKIELSVKRKNQKDVLDFKMKREIIKVKSVRAHDLGDQVLYTRINSFQENSFDELSSEIKKAEKAGVKLGGLILDLRDNPGGLLDQAVKISDLFIEAGIIVSTVGRDPKKVEREFAHKPGTYSDFPMVVLINGGSASASEIVAGALQDHKRAMIVGEQSFGKGSVQTLVSLPNGAGLKITVARYYTPNDRSIQAKGIEPDILVPMHTVADKTQKMQKESDLKGHIEGTDLSSISQNNRLLKSVQLWPEPMQKDHQLVTAFSYVKSWTLFKQYKAL